MQLRHTKVSILLTTLLCAACSSNGQETMDAESSVVSEEMGVEGHADLLGGLSADLRGLPGCGEGGGCPVDLPVARPVVYKFWGSAANDVWAVGKGSLTMNWNGTSWRRFPNAGTVDLWAVWGSSSTDVWAVGDNATILHWNGSAWSKTSGLPTMNGFNDVWGTSATDAWAVGNGGTVLHWDGTKWSQVSIPYINGFMTVWGAAANDVWVGGEAGLLLHWDGTKMNEVATSRADTIWRIRGSSASNAYMGTDSASYVQQWDGTKWTTSTTGYGFELWVASDNRVWTLTDMIMGCGVNLWNGFTWVYKSIGGCKGHATAIWTTDKDGWLGDDSGTLIRYNGTDWKLTW